MHEVMFRLKRAHLRAVEFAKPMAALFGLTPARFDVLYAIKQSSGYVLTQRQLGEALGLAPATISKIVERMEACGLVRRETREDDRRMKCVTMTSRGIDAIGAAIHAFLRLDQLRAAYRSIHGGDPPKSQAFLAIVRRSLAKIARHFGDGSHVAYPTRGVPPREAEDALDRDIQRWRDAVAREQRGGELPFVDPARRDLLRRGNPTQSQPAPSAIVEDDAASFMRELVKIAPRLRYLYE